jgi:hypothetical protein
VQNPIGGSGAGAQRVEILERAAVGRGAERLQLGGRRV